MVRVVEAPSSDTASRIIYGFAYGVQLVGVVIAAVGLNFVAKSPDLRNLWADQPDKVLSVLQKALRALLQAIQRLGLQVATLFRFDGSDVTVVAGPANVTGEFRMTGQGILSAGPAARFRPF